MKSKIVEKETLEGAYGMSYGTIIVDHFQHGLILLTQGWEGIDSPEGGAYRWKHGQAVKLQPGDTLQRLKTEMWNEHTTLGQAVLAGYDITRPILNFPGYMVESMAINAIKEETK